MAGVARAHDPIGSVTWIRDVEPLFRARCSACHAADGPALPRLDSYEDVVARSAAVKAAVMSRQMPIWAPVRGVGRFAHDPSLSPYQISIIASWIEARTPRGASVGLLDQSRPPADLLPIPSGRIVKLELEGPSNPAGVDRQTLRVRPSGSGLVGWRFDPGDPTLQQATVSDGSGRVLWTWFPGSSGENFPSGTAFVPAASTLIVETTRRTREAGGQLRAPKRTLSFLTLWLAPRGRRPLAVVPIPCGSSAPFSGVLHAIRPSSPRESRTQLVQERRGNRHVLGDFVSLAYQHPRSYWLREPADIAAGSVLRAEGVGCAVDLLVSGRAR